MGNKRNKQRKTYYSRSKKSKLHSETKVLTKELQKIEKEVELYSSIPLPENKPPSPPIINESFNSLKINDPILSKNGPSTSGYNGGNLDSNAWGTDEDFDSIIAHKLSVETEVPKHNVDGYRIVDLSHLLQTSLTLAENHARRCTAGNLFIEKEKKMA
ncbi:hypothetical protein FQR65_LT16820 [Abscondita terminalis]|nr:hypothetical protein FQR65_LT16820 [Abscondita terminalis]